MTRLNDPRNLLLGVASLLVPLAFDVQSSHAAAAAPAPPAATKSPWTFSGSLALKESHDSNVYLQDTDPLPANVAAAEAAGLTPVNRDDWIYTPSVSVSYTLDKHFTGELAYAYDWVESQVANTTGREYTRNFVSRGLKYTF